MIYSNLKKILKNNIFIIIKDNFLEFLIFFNAKLDLIPSYLRKICLIIIDGIYLSCIFFLQFRSHFLNNFQNAFLSANQVLFLMFLLGMVIYFFTGQYKSLSRYIGSRSFYKFTLRNIFLFFIYLSFGILFKIPLPTINEILIAFVFLNFAIIFSRLVLRDVLFFLKNLKRSGIPKVAIYGAGEAGALLEQSLRISGHYEVITFIDDSIDLSGRNLNSIPIRLPEYLSKIKDDIDFVLLAIPSLNSIQFKRIIKYVSNINLPILEVPSIEDLVTGKAKIDALKPIPLEKLLGRKSIKNNIKVLEKSISNKSICITGAGGSIGSELCRQVLNLNPKELVLIENSEPSLYAINNELNNLKKEVKITPVLVNCKKYDFLKNIFRKHSVQIVFHAAAYKHVPLVEENPLAGLSNNVFSTKVLCRLCVELNIKKFILISTDKAVRPTNVMGASKRLSEIIVQSFAHQQKLINKKIKTKFSIVRFGNVLGSSGSVIPLFRQQITKGGPLTVTHPDVIRYFMTINEAAQLVLYSSVLSKGGELFLLDMGEPVKIKDLAEQMIKLSGLRLKDKHNPNGDIEIIYSGLRPGEKLFEELLIDGDVIPTSNKSIFRVKETYKPTKKVFENIDKLETYINLCDNRNSLKLLSKIIPEWKISELTLSKLNKI